MIRSIKGALADHYGLRVLPPDGEPDVTAVVKEGEKETELRLFAHDSDEIKISTFHLVERVVRQLFKFFIVFSSVSIALLGIIGILDVLAPVFAVVSIISTIVSVILFFTSWYCDHRFKQQVKENNWLPLVKLTKETWIKITTSNYELKLKDSEDSDSFIDEFKVNVRNNQVYIPQAELDLFLSKSVSPTKLFTQALEALKSGTTAIYTNVRKKLSATHQSKTKKLSTSIKEA